MRLVALAWLCLAAMAGAVLAPGGWSFDGASRQRRATESPAPVRPASVSSVRAGGNGRALLGNIIPGLSLASPKNLQKMPAQLASMPMLDNLLRNLALNSVPRVQHNDELNAAIEEFAAPLVRFASGGQLLQSDIQDLIRSIPSLVVYSPNAIDINKVPPRLISHVMSGGQIPGIPKNVLDRLVAGFAQKMAAAAEAFNKGTPQPDGDRYLPRLENLPSDVVSQVLSGRTLPGLDINQMQAVQTYYMSQIGQANNTAAVAPVNSTGRLTLQEMMKYLPAGYDLNHIPLAVKEAAMRGETPNLALLPQDLRDHIQAQLAKIHASPTVSAKSTLEEILARLPKYPMPKHSKEPPYDINTLNTELVLEEEEARKAKKVRVLTWIVLPAVAVLSIFTVLLLWWLRVRRGGASDEDVVETTRSKSDDGRPAIPPVEPHDRRSAPAALASAPELLVPAARPVAVVGPFPIPPTVDGVPRPRPRYGVPAVVRESPAEKRQRREEEEESD